jgi:dCTP deaminase
MILTGPAIRAHLAAGTIRIHPLTDDPGDSQVDQAGVTLHLHPRLLECWTRKAARAEGLRDADVAPLDVRTDDGDRFFPVDLDETGAFLLLPGRFYLGATIERIFAPCHVVRVDGKSSPARKGLEIHRTAGHVEPGFRGAITLEISVLTPLRIPPGWPVCQAVFHEVRGPVESYADRGHYSDASAADGPQVSRSHLHRARHVGPPDPPASEAG